MNRSSKHDKEIAAAMDVITDKKIVDRRFLKEVLGLEQVDYDPLIKSLLRKKLIVKRKEGKSTMLYLKATADMLGLDNVSPERSVSTDLPIPQYRDAKLYNRLSAMMAR